MDPQVSCSDPQLSSEEESAVHFKRIPSGHAPFEKSRVGK